MSTFSFDLILYKLLLKSSIHNRVGYRTNLDPSSLPHFVNLLIALHVLIFWK